MSKIKGTVTRTGKGKFSYFVGLDSKDGFYFNTKFEPKCNEGDVVGIEYEQKGETRGNIQKIVVLEANPNPPAKDSWDSSEPGKWSEADVSNYKKAIGGVNRQDSIVWQHSQEMGIQMTALLVANGGFTVKGKADAIATQLTEKVNEIAYSQFNDALDPRASVAFTTNAELAKDTEEPDAEIADENVRKSDGDSWDEDWVD